MVMLMIANIVLQVEKVSQTFQRVLMIFYNLLCYHKVEYALAQNNLEVIINERR